MPCTISICNLSIGYGQNVIANTINFELFKGELVGIVGINGIGKSTLLKTMAKLLRTLGGELSILENKIENLTTNDLSKLVALVLTEPLATKNLTVEEVLALGRQPYTNWMGTLSSKDRIKIESGISQFHLNTIRGKKCFELSDGQLQRVMIARAMVQDTPLIILDEPTTHLDLQNKVQILRLLQQLAHEYEKTVVFSTHEIELAIQLCDKILILDGKDNPFGKPYELIEKSYFSNLFSSDLVVFDVKTASFRIKK